MGDSGRGYMPRGVCSGRGFCAAVGSGVCGFNLIWGETMKTTINVHDFRQAFKSQGRGEQFTYEGLGVLFDYLEELEADTDTEIELDVVALCCDYAESDIDDILADYNIDIADDADDDARQDAVRGYLGDHTAIIGEFDNKFIYAQF